MAKIRSIFTGNNTFANKNIVEEIWPGDKYRKPYSAAGIQEPLLTQLADTDALKSAMTHFFHLTGTCSLGSCTNLDGEVSGISGLSVCDNSILPANPDANPTATLIAVCNKIAKRRLAKDDCA
jgi:choline dehydrogenase